MARTYTQDFNKDDGAPVTVEYKVEGSYSPTTYSPHSGAVGGDFPIFSILSSWPNTEEYNELYRREKQMDEETLGKSIRSLMITADDDARREQRDEVERRLDELERAAQLTDAERERMEGWLAENYVEDEPDIEF